MVAKGRDEDSLPFAMAWVWHHDRYEELSQNTDSCVSMQKEAHL
jgi:hypothetical protein